MTIIKNKEIGKIKFSFFKALFIFIARFAIKSVQRQDSGQFRTLFILY